MSTFAAPEYVYIINDLSQADVKFYDSLDVSITTLSNNTDKVNFSPVFTELKKGDIVTALKTSSSPGTVQVATLLFNAGASAGDNIRVRVMFNSLEQLGTDVASVNNETPYVVDYYATSMLTPALLAQKIKDLFDATTGYPFTVTISGATLTFTAKKPGYAFTVHTGGWDTTFTVTTAPTSPIGTYEAIIPYFNNIYQHHNLQAMPMGDLLNKPQVMTTYTTYYWETKGKEKVGGHGAHSEIIERFHRYRVYVNSSLTTLITELDKIT